MVFVKCLVFPYLIMSSNSKGLTLEVINISIIRRMGTIMDLENTFGRL